MGDSIVERGAGQTVESVSVIGTGTMGLGIAHVAALGGFRTLLYDADPAAIERARQTIERNLEKGVARGKVEEAQASAALERLEGAAELGEAAGADLVIEAIPEDIRLKVELLQTLDGMSPAHTLFATNTSALSITEMAGAVRRSEQVIGMHFFNPVHIMKLVEVIRGLQSSDVACATVFAVARRMGKDPVEVNESPGFVTTRINALIGNEAFYLLQEGVASPRDIDKALKLGLNHPMGPFELADLVGLDTRLANLKFLHATLGEKYRPCPLIEKYVRAGRLGKKSGRGVYDYDEEAGS